MQGNHKYHAILLADSRARGFTNLDQGKFYTYDVHYVVRPGYTIRDLTADALTLVRNISPDNTTLLIKIAAGINNLTLKINRRRAYEIAPSTATANTVLAELVNLKRAIKEIRPDAIVSYMTIPPVNFIQQLSYWQEKRCLPFPIYTQEERLEFQEAHEIIVSDINQNIKELNYNEQRGIHCQTSSWHSAVLRRQRGKDRLIVSALIDGIHGSNSSKIKWHRGFHQAIQKEISRLNANN